MVKARPLEVRASFECCGMTRTDAAEDALKAMWELSGDGIPLSTGALAQFLGVTPPTASAMLKRLADHGLVDREDGRTVELTEHGSAHARFIVRRHRLIETFLSTVLLVPWDELYAEAELLEHAVSDSLLERIDELLGHPSSDPHGDPIPQGTERALATPDESIVDAPVGHRFRVERLHNRNAEALRYLAELGLRPGVVVEVLERSPFDGPLWISLDGQRLPLGTTLAQFVHGHSVEGGA